MPEGAIFSKVTLGRNQQVAKLNDWYTITTDMWSVRYFFS